MEMMEDAYDLQERIDSFINWTCFMERTNGWWKRLKSLQIGEHGYGIRHGYT